MQIQRTLIELCGEPMGVAVQEQKGWRFYAADAGAYGMDKRLFASPRAIEEACRKLGAAAGPRFSARFFAHDRTRVVAEPLLPVPEGGMPYAFPFAHY